ncbi:hypothetical protein ABVF47_003245 [Snodgrassella alvi]|uniref:hypothetical protein n=1 Tax=Snodgrassella alvi TaxID=1196083 RepID=UPI00352F446D
MEQQHSVSPYIIRCYDPKYENSHNRFLFDKKHCGNYMLLDDLKGLDLLTIFHDFLSSISDQDHSIKEQKTLFRVHGLKVVPEKRVIYGYIDKGDWGTPARIQDSWGQKEPYNMSHTEAMMVSHFFYFYIPQDREEGICLFENVGNSGIKTLFSEYFNAFYKKYLPGRKLKILPLQHGEIYEEWKKAIAKSIKVINFKHITDDMTDQMKSSFGEYEETIELKLKKPFNLQDFNIFNKFSGELKDSLPSKMVALWEEEGSKVRGEFYLNGKKKVFQLGNIKSARCELLIDETEVAFDDGIPNHEGLVAYCQNITEDIKRRIYNYG